MKFVKGDTGLLRSARRATLALLVPLSTLAGVGFTGGATSLAQQPVPEAYFKTLPPDVPSEVLIGETFKFNVRFKNTGNAVGFGPFIDLAINSRGADNNTQDSSGVPQPCDGIDFVSAEMVDVNPPLNLTNLNLTHPVTTACTTLSGTVNVNHPYGNGPGLPGPVTLPAAGWQLVTIEHPFGNYDPTPPYGNRPEIVVEVTAKVHDFADVNTPLEICTRGGFRFASVTGGLPIMEQGNDVIIDNWECQPVTPRVFKIKKEYLGPEDETATGPNFIHKYKITVDIATGQTIGKNLTMKDCLPSGMAYEGGLGVTPPWPFHIATEPPIGSVNDPPVSCLEVSWINVPLVGVPGPDATVEFQFSIRDKYANGYELLQDCVPVLIANGLTVTGNWSPKDPRDSGGTITGSNPNAHELYAKCMAIQKVVAGNPPDPKHYGGIPGNSITFELNFQISDYKTIGNIVVTDYLSDGHRYVPGATLTVTDRLGTVTGSFVAGTNLFETHPDTSFVCKVPPKVPQITGGTKLVFDVSGAMAALAPSQTNNNRHNAGILTGGEAPPSDQTPAHGKIVFQAKIQDQYDLPKPSPDLFIDKYDPLTNCVEIQGDVFKNEPLGNPPGSNVPPLLSPPVKASDDSDVDGIIVFDIFKKSVYAVKRPGVTTFGGFVCGGLNPLNCMTPPTPVDVHPLDEVTFRLEYTVPSSDAENLKIQDWLPLPIFDVRDPDGNLTSGIGPPSYGWTPFNGVIPICGAAPPAPGTVCRLNSDTLTAFVAPPPNLSSVDGATNSLTFTYGTFNDPTNTPRTIDLVFTIVANAKPFADGFHVTNEVQECEDNTFGVKFCKVAVAPIKMHEPALRIRKGVVKASNPNAVFNPSPPLPASVAFNPGSSCPTRFNPWPPFTAQMIWNPSTFNSDVTGVDAGDTVSFAIVVENYGSGLYGAFDVEIEDIFPIPDLEFDMTTPICINDGNGAVIPWVFTGGPGPAGFKLKLMNPSSTQGALYANPNAPAPSADPRSIAIITFNAAKLNPNIKPGCYPNKAEIKNYATTNGGPNFVPNFGTPLSDTADVCVRPVLTKFIKTTSEAHTADPSFPTLPTDDTFINPRPVAIGEIIRYRLQIELPEGVSPSFRITDLLPAGLAYLNDGTTKVGFVATSTTPPGINWWGAYTGNLGDIVPISNATPISVLSGTRISGGPFNCGAAPTFDLGTVTNPDTDSNLEFIIVEFNALVCNIAGNIQPLPLENKFEVKIQAPTTPTYTSTSVWAKIVEPKLTMTKTVDPTTVHPGGTVYYAVTFTNSGTADAFDVVFTDPLPFGLTLVSGSVTFSPPGSPPGCSVGSGITVNCVQVPKGSTVTIKYQATVSTTVPCNTHLTNRAKVTWTSLPGPNGTMTNPTNSSTPGNSGAPNGERNGSSAYPPNPLNSPNPPNDYFATASATVTVLCPKVCDLAIKKEVTPNPVASGGTVTITLTVTNVGTGPCPLDVVVQDPPTSGLTVPPQPVSVNQLGWLCNILSGGLLHCIKGPTLPSLPPSYTTTFTFTANVTAPPNSTITNCATVMNLNDTITGNNQDCVTISVGGGPPWDWDLALRKTREGNLVSGQPGRYILTVTNVGNGPTTGPISVTDLAPESLTPVSATGTNWTCKVSGRLVTCTTPGPFAPGQSSTITLTVRVTAPPGANATNCATVETRGDANPANDKDCISVPLAGGEQPSASDLGDAPDSTNHANTQMDAYPNIPANFPTVYDPNLAGNTPPGPIHLNAKGDAWLGKDVTFEGEADQGWDQDGVNNIKPGANTPNQDNADDGVILPIILPAVGCGTMQFQYTVTVVGPQKPRYVNVWFDFNQDGDWQDTIPCFGNVAAREWAVQNQMFNVGAGFHTLTTPPFRGFRPTFGPPGMWMRITLTDSPVASAQGANGSGPVGGYKFGETEDYLLDMPPVVKPPDGTPVVVEPVEITPGLGTGAKLCVSKFHDLNANGVQDPGEPGLPNWTFTVSGGVGTITTGPQGSFCSVVPAPGTYTASEQGQPGWTPTTPNPQTVTVSPGQSVNLSFGNKKGVPPGEAKLCVTKYNDLNANGVQDPGEPGLPNWTFTVSGGVGTVTTGPQGTICRVVPAPAAYTASEQGQPGWTPTTPNSQQANVSPGQSVNLSFGNQKKKDDDKKCDLTIEKTGDPPQPSSGHQVFFNITMKNVGTGPCGPETVVQDPRPQGLTFTAPPVANQPGWACSLPGGNASCVTAGTLPPGYTARFTFPAIVTAPPGGTSTNCATVSNRADSNPASNQSCATIQVQRGVGPPPRPLDPKGLPVPPPPRPFDPKGLEGR